MRIGLTHNKNGAVCDICLKPLLPEQIIHLEAKQINTKDKWKGTKTIRHNHLCLDCYCEMFQDLSSLPLRKSSKEK